MWKCEAELAQSVERAALNRVVGGSIPSFRDFFLAFLIFLCFVFFVFPFASFVVVLVPLLGGHHQEGVIAMQPGRQVFSTTRIAFL